MTSAQQIQINGKSFQIAEEGIAKDGRKQYVLAGKRGARYGTMRNDKNPDIMFLIDLRGFGIPAGFQGTWLTDRSGQLEALR